MKRPLLRYHGGKWVLAPWIISHFPRHRIYVEPFGGAASVLLRKQPAHSEIYNDLDGEVVGLFRVLRDRAAADELICALELTPFSRDEFDLSYEPAENPVEQSRRLIIRSFMGFGSDGFRAECKTGFRVSSTNSGTAPAKDWARYPDALKMIIERIRFDGVSIENRDAMKVMQACDGPTPLHYVDPPYLPSLRSLARKSVRQNYRHELTEEDHKRLLEFLKGLEGMVVLSGYPSELYDRALMGWIKSEREALADGASKRIECLWINPACASALEKQRAGKKQLQLWEQE